MKHHGCGFEGWDGYHGCELLATPTDKRTQEAVRRLAGATIAHLSAGTQLSPGRGSKNSYLVAQLRIFFGADRVLDITADLVKKAAT